MKISWKVTAVILLGLFCSYQLSLGANLLKFGTLSDVTVGLAIGCWIIASLWPLLLRSVGRYRYLLAIALLVSFFFGFVYGGDDCGYGSGSGTDICVRYSCAQNAHQVLCAGRRAGPVIRATFQIACPRYDFFDYTDTPEKCGG